MMTEDFVQQLEQVFDRPDHATNAGDRLFALRQGNRSAAEYAVEFRILSVEAAWKEPPLMSMFQRGLNGTLRHALMAGRQPENLDVLID